MIIATAKNVSTENDLIRADVKVGKVSTFYICMAINGKCDRSKVKIMGDTITADQSVAVMNAIDEVLGA